MCLVLGSQHHGSYLLGIDKLPVGPSDYTGSFHSRRIRNMLFLSFRRDDKLGMEHEVELLYFSLALSRLLLDSLTRLTPHTALI